MVKFPRQVASVLGREHQLLARAVDRGRTLEVVVGRIDVAKTAVEQEIPERERRVGFGALDGGAGGVANNETLGDIDENGFLLVLVILIEDVSVQAQVVVERFRFET
jgi:hypothetical protein